MLPKNESQFHLSVIGETSQERYEGDFTCVCVPSLGLRNRISRDETRECGDLNNVPPDLFFRARWLANVKNRLIDWPDWWSGCGQGDTLMDDNVIKALYDECLEAEKKWRQSVKDKSQQASASVSTPQTPQA